MPKLKTNRTRSVIPPSSNSRHICISTYEEYVEQREEQPNISNENVEELTENFKKNISQPLRQLNPDIEMGEYYVIPVAELKEMLDADQNVEFIHVCNALRGVKNSQGEVKAFPVTILVPYQKTIIDSQPVFEACKNGNSVYIEAYPCPPDPRCPIGPGLAGGNIFKANTKFNQFNALF